MSYQTLEIEIRDRIATVWMNRPETHNALDDISIRELTEAFAQLDRDPAARVVVLAGRGKSFSTGADLKWMARAAEYSTEENLHGARALAAMFKTLQHLSKPTIARVHGAAIGGGVGLTAACDIAIATASASFATSEARLGIVPAVIGPYVIKAIGERMARRYFLTAERFDAQEAQRIGLVHAVCAADALDGAIAEMATVLIANGPKALAAAKELIFEIAGRPIDDALIESTAQRIATVRATPEAKDGIRAFLDKRKPRWQIEE